MEVREMKEFILDAYGRNPHWEKRVNGMADKQIMAVYYSILNRANGNNKKKRNEPNVKKPLVSKSKDTSNEEFHQMTMFEYSQELKMREAMKRYIDADKVIKAYDSLQLDLNENISPRDAIAIAVENVSEADVITRKDLEDRVKKAKRDIRFKLFRNNDIAKIDYDDIEKILNSILEDPEA